MPRTSPVLLILLLLAVLASSASAATFPGDPVVGPSAALRSLGGVDLAPDGSGALVTTIQEGGVDHVFASRLVNGAWSAPERLDGGLDGPSAQPAVAAADGGRVVIAFANGGNVYAVTRADAGAGWVRQTLWSGGGASDPHVDVSVNGKAYAVFAAPGAGGHDVRVAHARSGGAWTVIGAPLDANPGNDAGAGAGRAHVAASADGVGIVVWGEAGRVFARRVQGVRPSVVSVDALDGLVLEGLPAIAADSPVVSTQDDDSFTGVAFRAVFDVGGTPRSRAVFRRLRGSRFETPVAVDAAPFASGQGSVSPRIATVGTGQGLVVAGNDVTNTTSALNLLFDVEPSTLVQADSLFANTTPGFAVPATATARKMVVAWQATPPGGAPAIHGRYRDGGDFEAELALSRPELGPTVAADGLFAAGDDSGNIAVAWIQDVPGQGRAVVVAAVDQPPARFGVKAIRGFQRSDRPLLTWGIAREQWGRYFKVTIDGVEAGVTGQRSFRPRTPLAQGTHTWQVTALDRRGQQFAARGSSVKVDSVAAFVRARLTGARHTGGLLRLLVQATDTPTGTARKAAGVVTSGVREILVDWGDGAERERIQRGTQHAYARSGRYVLRVFVTDRAGNRTLVRQRLKIARPPSGGRARRGRRGAAAIVLRSAPPRR
ncbi:MAG TPA: hypothetical protein VK506_03590 [Conexibacter sp.]|nr:hypothetical protein [Conexibacter sp.]